MTKLSVNLNKVALLRNQRDLPHPSVIGMGRIAVAAGAHGLTVHPRPDERHIRRSDVRDLAALFAAGLGEGVEFNIEGYPDEEFMALVAEARPDQVTLVPDAPDQATSDHGWDFVEQKTLLIETARRLKEQGARVSMFCDPDPEMAARAADCGAERVELYTGPYYLAHVAGEGERSAEHYARAAEAAIAEGMAINAGHDLTTDNLPLFLRMVPDVEEVSIGHALTADALIHGMEGAVKKYLAAIAGAGR